MEYRTEEQISHEPNNKKKRKTFLYEEDQKLIMLVQEHGTKNWDFISSEIGTRNARQCRERWKFYLCPSVNLSPWTPEEDRILFDKYNIYGPKWSIIREYFDNRSLNNVKNRWNSIMRKIKALNLNVKSEEDFFYCGRLITKNPPNLHNDINDEDQILKDTNQENNQQFDPFYFVQINNLLNQLPETV